MRAYAQHVRWVAQLGRARSMVDNDRRMHADQARAQAQAKSEPTAPRAAAMRHDDVSPVKHPTGGKFCELGGGKSRRFANQSRILSI